MSLSKLSRSLFLAFMLTGAARAADTDADADNAQRRMEASLRVMINGGTSGLPGRVEVEVGKLDPRSATPPCADVEPFIPAGTKLWGRATLGLRCRDGTRWSVLVPVQVRVYAPAPHTARSFAPGEALGVDDVSLIDTELTREPPGLLTSIESLGDLVLARALPAGTPLRREFFKPRQAAAAGDAVTLVYSAPGFTVSGAGKALHAAGEGQGLRVQLESGRIVSGVARAGRVVEVRF